MAPTTLPATLHPPLSVREAVADAIYRFVLGADANDVALFESSFVPDASIDINGDVTHGLDAIRAVYETLSKLSTTHHISNVRVNVEEGRLKATLTATALAQHYRPNQGLQEGAAGLLAGGLYYVDVVKDEKDELWKIKQFRLQVLWREGDTSILAGE